MLNRLTSAVVRLGFPRASRIPTHLTAPEKLALLRLARSAGPVCVEIGSYLGASASFIATGSRMRWGSRSVVYCVDTWGNHGMTEGERDTWAEFKANTAPWADAIKPLRGMSVAVASGVAEPIDFLFIDGGHDYESVRADADVWLPKVRTGGTVALHDWGWAEGVQRVVRESIQPHATLEGTLPNLYWAHLR
jgi:predicted O-methyltransferase YrrM